MCMKENDETRLAEVARSKWLSASDSASKLHNELFQRGSGYGNPDDRAADEHLLESSKLEAERLFREYYDIDRRCMERKMLKLQRSQTLATWASFAVAAVVGVATVINYLVPLFK